MRIRIIRIVTPFGLEYYRAIKVGTPINSIASDKYLNNLIRRLQDNGHTIVNAKKGEAYTIKTIYTDY